MNRLSLLRASLREKFMNVPAIAKSTFELLKNQPEFSSITQTIIKSLKKIKNNFEKARFIHNVVDEYNKEVFSHPLLVEFVPCKSGCSACCHTQVSVTTEEAELLIHHIDNGVDINYELLSLQSEAQNNAENFYKLSYQERACVFLSEKGACKVYKDRPSVCRTNAVIGEASQCATDTSGPGPQRLVKTSKADMAIVGAYCVTAESGALPYMLAKLLKERNQLENINALQSLVNKLKNKKSESNNRLNNSKNVFKDPQI